MGKVIHVDFARKRVGKQDLSTFAFDPKALEVEVLPWFPSYVRVARRMRSACASLLKRFKR